MLQYSSTASDDPATDRQPGHRLAQVAVLDLEPGEPRCLFWSLHACFGGHRQVPVVGRVPIAGRFQRTACRQLGDPELADRLQHAEASLSLVVEPLDEAVVDQGPDQIRHRVRIRRI